MTEKNLVPSTPMGNRYVDLKEKSESGKNTEEQLRKALIDVENVVDLSNDFLESVAKFGRFVPREGEGFYDHRGEDALGSARARAQAKSEYLANGVATSTTAEIASRIIDKGLLSDSIPGVTYVDREIVSSRTTGPEYEDETSKGARISLDLLLALGSQPVVAEVKAGGDQNAYYALIQGLASCAQLASPQQRKRLKIHAQKAQETLNQQREPHGRSPSDVVELAEVGPMELWIVLSRHNSRGPEKSQMLKTAKSISEGLVAIPAFAEVVSRIRCVDAVVPAEGPVIMEEDTEWEKASLA